MYRLGDFADNAAMQVDVIESYAGFQKLQRNWDAVYDADPEAPFFLSWTWLSQVLVSRSSGWCILAVRPQGAGGDYVAFFPLRLIARFSRSRGRFCNFVHMAGSFSWADYTGFICQPDDDERAIPALAAHLKGMHWAAMHLKHNCASDRRLELFLEQFDEAAFAIEDQGGVDNGDGVDNAICPYVQLPGDFETYLRQGPSANTRQKLRRFLRQLDGSAELRITHSTPDTHERDIDVLLTFWKRLWAQRKGSRLEPLARRYRQILREGFAGGNLEMPVLWHGDTPLGALGHFIDHRKKALLYFIAGRDDAWKSPPPGFILHAHSIRWAIENGLKTYDFLRGNEPFKYSFGATDRRIRNILVRTRSGANLHGALDPRCIDDVTDQAIDYHEDQRLEEALAGYRQVLDARPDHPEALRRCARLLYQSGRYAESAALARRLVEIEPADGSAWRQVGKAHLALNQFSDAESAFRASNALGATISAHHGLAQALAGQGRFDEAVIELHAVLILSPRGPRETRQKQDARRHLEQIKQAVQGQGADVA